MKSYSIGIATIAFLVSFSTPKKVERVDFRNHLLPEEININQSSPAFAALEDVLERSELSAIEFGSAQNITEPLKLISPIAGGKSEKIYPVVEHKIELPASVISDETKVDHLAHLIQATEITPVTPTMQELAQALVDEELDRRKVAENLNLKFIRTEAGGEIIVSAEETKAIDSKPHSLGPISKIITPIRAIEVPARSDAPAESKRKGTRQVSRYILSGPITMTGGAALTHPRDELIVRHQVDGKLASLGVVFKNEAFYEIAVDSLEGEIVTEARGVDGHLLATGKLQLATLAGRHTYKAQIKDIPIKLMPAFHGVVASVVSSANMNGKSFPVADAKLYIKGLSREITRQRNSSRFEDDTIGAPSRFLLRAQQDNFWPTLVLSASGEEKQVRLFPKAFIEALFGLTLNKYEAFEAKDKGIIWGRITHQGLPLEGAKVESVYDPSAESSYFTGFIADTNRTLTSSNGEFAITRLSDGEKFLKVSIGAKQYWPTFLPVEKGHVTFADLEIESEKIVDIKSYDAFSFDPLAAEFQPLGKEELHFINDKGLYRLKANLVKGTSLLECQAGSEYLPTRVALYADQSEVQIPHLKATFLDSLREQAKIAVNESTTRTVGFIEGDDYELVIGSGELEGITQIVYFDSEGKIVSSGRAGGGFVIFNLPHGIQALTVIPDKSKKVVTQTVYADAQAVHVLNINLIL